MGDHEAGRSDLTADDMSSDLDTGDDTETKTENLEAGRRLFAGECRFIAGAARIGQIPDLDLPEIAFAGRSNVGKSSLINALTGRKTLARTSNEPGRTREVNFFLLGGRLVLADLPGYGYARASKKQVASWTTLIEDYLKGRAPLRRVCLLIDARHGLKENDLSVMAMLDTAAVSYQAVLTKCDKVKEGLLAAGIHRLTEELAQHAAAHPEVFATSARRGREIPELRAALAALAHHPTE